MIRDNDFQDPTFIVISDNANVDYKKAMQNPFVVTSDAKEVVQFLESNR